jgi:hypothetical protein
MVGTSLCPYEADAPLLVDADAVLTRPVAFQRFEAIVRRHGEIAEQLGVVEHPKFPECGLLNILWQDAAEPALPDGLGFGGSKANDHPCYITLCVMDGKRILTGRPSGLAAVIRDAGGTRPRPEIRSPRESGGCRRHRHSEGASGLPTGQVRWLVFADHTLVLATDLVLGVAFRYSRGKTPS